MATRQLSLLLLVQGQNESISELCLLALVDQQAPSAGAAQTQVCSYLSLVVPQPAGYEALNSWEGPTALGDLDSWGEIPKRAEQRAAGQKVPAGNGCMSLVP